jgi:hypothetical protein
MQGWAAKVACIRGILGSENEIDGVTGCTSVEGSSESDCESGATLDGHDICANKLTMAVAYASSWRSRLEFTQVCTEAMGALGEDKAKVRIFAASEYGQSAEVLKGILRHILI